VKNVSAAGDEKRFQLVGGHPALDFVNTLDWRFRENPEDLIAGYDDLVRFTLQCGLMTTAESRRLLRSTGTNNAARALTQTRMLREAAAQIFYASVDRADPPAAAIRELERSFKQAEAHRRLLWSVTHLRWEFPAASAALELPLWILSLETAQLLISGRMEMVRSCGNPECRWLFLDTSKNHTRRWCDMKICGNRMKARRFKAQHR
jgi:predicted RNA-binding Zn ribbon-like protein